MTNNKEDLSLVILLFIIIAIVTFLPNSHPPHTEVYYKSHIVEQGETLSGIVEEYGGSLGRTKAVNPSVIMPGEKIVVVIEGR